MKREILVSVDENETRIAILGGGKLEELFIERHGEKRVAGSIYKGIVTSVMPGMQAAFVNINLEKDGFLYVSKVMEGIEVTVDENFPSGSIERLLKEGNEIMVQVLREPIGGKGARISSFISLPGKYLVLMPTVPDFGVSRRITDEAERRRLKALIRRIAPQNKGLIVRTEGEGKHEKEFTADIRYLMRTWEAIERTARRQKAPQLIHEELDAPYKMVRDILSSEMTKIIVDDIPCYKRLRRFARTLCPDLGIPIELYRGREQLFEVYNVEQQIDIALSEKVKLESGGYIVIEETEALASIDVNTGRFKGGRNFEETALRTNLEAASEVARQLRLRNIGGIIIIDFIDMNLRENKKKVLRHLQRLMNQDRAKITILELSDLGLVEMTRERVRKSLSKTLYERCPYCRGSGHVSSAITASIRLMRKLKHICRVSRDRDITVRVNPKVKERALNEDREKLNRLQRRFRKRVQIESDERLQVQEIEFP